MLVVVVVVVYLTTYSNGITSMQTTEVFWKPSRETIERRLLRYEVPVDSQEQFESKRLGEWCENNVILFLNVNFPDFGPA